MNCCCCGQPLPMRRHPFRWGLVRRIYEFVALSPRGVQIKEIADHLWGHDREGGPLDWKGVIRQTIIRANKTLRKHDLMISKECYALNDLPYNLRRVSTGNIWLPIWRESTHETSG